MSDPVTKLILEFSKLPSIGEKTATRLAHHILRTDEAEVQALSHALIDAKQKVRLCDQCFMFSEFETCHICKDTQRKQDVLCIVEKPSDVHAIENSDRFFGKYHILHGVLSPLDGIGPDQLRIRELLVRIQSGTVHEVILALNPSVEGEATTAYLTKLLKPLDINVTKIAYGIPIGGVLEYVDRQTIGRAIENRVST